MISPKNRPHDTKNSRDDQKYTLDHNEYSKGVLLKHAKIGSYKLMTAKPQSISDSRAYLHHS